MPLLGQLAAQPQTPSGSFWHKKIYPDQVWLDGLYRCGPFHAWDESKAMAWADPLTGLSPQVWGRAVSWTSCLGGTATARIWCRCSRILRQPQPAPRMQSGSGGR